MSKLGWVYAVYPLKSPLAISNKKKVCDATAHNI